MTYNGNLTMSKTNYTFNDIKTCIPHRYENMLLDEIEVSSSEEETVGHFTTQINTPDTHQRDVFLQTEPLGKKVLIPTLMMEIIALAAIVSTGVIPEGHIAFFAVISNFKKTGNFLSNQKVKGIVKKLKGKADFLRYSGQLLNDDQTEIASGNIMAMYADTRGGLPENDPKLTTVPTASLAFPISKNPAYRAPHMVLVDELIDYNAELGTCATRYTYPTHHPITKGHFPGNPIMMGVMQWLTINDACYALGKYLKQNQKSGDYTISGDGILLKADGAITTEVKGFTAQLTMGVDGTLDHTELIETKKVVFRSIVHPGDTLFVKLSNLVIS